MNTFKLYETLLSKSKGHLDTLAFSKSCQSEGLIHKGLRRPYTLAANVNDECFINLMQMECDRGSSRILDILEKSKVVDLNNLYDRHDRILSIILNSSNRIHVSGITNRVLPQAQGKKVNLMKKLNILRNQWKNFKVMDNLLLSKGTRKIYGMTYVKKKCNLNHDNVSLARNIRPSRINRACRRRKKVDNKPNVTKDINCDELSHESRNPLNLTNKNVEFLTEDHKSLMRKGNTFYPTPRKPVNEKKNYEDYLKFRENVRWAYWHAKQDNFRRTENDFITIP